MRVLRGAELTSQSAFERNIQPAWQSLKLLTRRYLNSGQGNKNPKKIVLDVRAKTEYEGEETLTGAVRPGRIPGVAWTDWRNALVKDGPDKGYWKSAEEIRKLFADLGVTPDKEIYIY